jgi:tRNA G18 (ribose-2'-O)-methylase SpoU
MSTDGTDLPKQIKDFVKEDRMFIKRFDKWRECAAYMKEQDIQLVGIEIHEKAQNIEEFVAQKSDKDVAFMPGNEGQGLNTKQMESCDAFCIISQYGGGTASLNVNVATSIILHRFHEYQRSQYEKTEADGVS